MRHTDRETDGQTEWCLMAKFWNCGLCSGASILWSARLWLQGRKRHRKVLSDLDRVQGYSHEPSMKPVDSCPLMTEKQFIFLNVLLKPLNV